MPRPAKVMEHAQSRTSGGEIPKKQSKLKPRPSESGGASGGTNYIWELRKVDKRIDSASQAYQANRLAAIDQISTVKELEKKLADIKDEAFPLHYEYMFVRRETVLQSKLLKITSLVPVDDLAVNLIGVENSFVLSFWKTKCINTMKENSPTTVGTTIEKISSPESSPHYKIWEISAI